MSRVVLWRGFGLSVVSSLALVPDLSGVPMHMVGPIGHDLGPTIGQGHSVLALYRVQFIGTNLNI